MNRITNELLKIWNEISSEAISDGLSIDIEIQGVSISDWNQFILIIRESYKYEYYDNGIEEKLPEIIDEFFFNSDTVRYIYLVDFRIECFILTLNEIEFNLSPNSYVTNSNLESLLSFFTKIAQRLNKNVEFRIEGAKSPFFAIQKSGNFLLM